ncbi:MAG: hypothetical protein HN389_11735 [Clostridia bacterium]|jgi:hypothetical protein|nr:hypothetical protein [Clostridia bacterium]
MNNDVVLLVLNCILLFGILPISFFWLRRAYKIGIKKDYSYVALKRGVPPDNPKKYAPFSLLINLIAGLVLVGLFIFVITLGIVKTSSISFEELKSPSIIVFLGMSLYGDIGSNIYETWTAVVGSTIWLKIIFSFVLSRQAHLNMKKK